MSDSAGVPNGGMNGWVGRWHGGRPSLWSSAWSRERPPTSSSSGQRPGGRCIVERSKAHAYGGRTL